MLRASGYHATFDDRFGIGQALAAFDPGTHTMMPTEAGYLPYLSRWKAVDPFGLNDEHIAHQGLTEEYIDARRPDLIMFHVDTAVYRERWTPPGADRWEAMTKTLHAYATSRGYELAAVIPKSARPEDGYHWYFVRPGGPDAAQIADLIRSRAPVAHAP